MRGIFIAGELGGMGLIKNSIEQGKQAMDHIFTSKDAGHDQEFDVLIIGAGPAGISASLQAKKYGLKHILLDQDSLGGTVYNFPRKKIVMTSPVDLPLFGKIKLFQTKKSELLELWQDVIRKNSINLHENTRVESIAKKGSGFEIITQKGVAFTSNKVLLAIGRRGSPRKLGVAGEGLEKVSYRLMESELIQGKKILVVGGGDSAIESALLLAEQNEVTLSYRGDKFNRLKPLNAEKIDLAAQQKTIHLLLNSNVTEILNDAVRIKINGAEQPIELSNDMVYILAGGELPTQFLQKSGIEITKRFGYTVKSHSK
jgi:thioredoxin reductase